MERLIYKEANGDLTCRSRDFDKVFPTLYAYEELELTPQEIEQQLKNFSSFLMEMTGGRMSKTNYTVQAMVDEAYDYSQKQLDEAEQKGYDLGVDSVLRNHFGIPWDEAADLRKSIDHLRELLKAEKDGLMMITPCKPDDTIYWILEDDGEFRISPEKIIEVGTRGFFVNEGVYDHVAYYFTPWDEIGKTAFLTEEGAKVALAKIVNGPGEKEG